MSDIKVRMRTLATSLGTVELHEADGWTGSGGDTLFLLHGIGSTSRSWVPQMHRLARERRVIAWNAPGYAGSEPLATEQPGAHDYANMLRATMDALGLETAAIAASSWGSLTALALAAQSPTRVWRLVLSGPAAGSGHLPPAERARIYAERSQRAQHLGISALLAQDASRLVTPGAGADVQAELEAGRQGVHLPGYLAALHMLCETDGGALMARVKQPVQIMAGERDLIAPPAAHATRLAALAPSATLALLPGCGHLPHIEQPVLFGDRVQTFLSQ